MMPVDETSTSSMGRPMSEAVLRAMATASCIPRAPVPALAHPELATIAERRLDAARWFRPNSTGDAAARLTVNTAAAFAG